jgi:hypothetical protein
MLRRVFTILSALSLLLCAATVVLWQRSYSTGHELGFHDHRGRWRVASEAGRFRIDNRPQLRHDRQQWHAKRMEYNATKDAIEVGIARLIRDSDGRKVTRSVDDQLRRLRANM